MNGKCPANGKWKKVVHSACPPSPPPPTVALINDGCNLLAVVVEKRKGERSCWEVLASADAAATQNKN